MISTIIPKYHLYHSMIFLLIDKRSRKTRESLVFLCWNFKLHVSSLRRYFEPKEFLVNSFLLRYGLFVYLALKPLVRKSPEISWMNGKEQSQ